MTLEILPIPPRDDKETISFPFDTTAAIDECVRLIKQRNELAESINTTMERCQGHMPGNLPPMVPWIMSMLRSGEGPDLKAMVALGRSLVSIAERFAKFEELDEKARSVSYIMKNPLAIASIFADLPAAVESGLHDLMNVASPPFPPPTVPPTEPDATG